MVIFVWQSISYSQRVFLKVNKFCYLLNKKLKFLFHSENSCGLYLGFYGTNFVQLMRSTTVLILNVF